MASKIISAIVAGIIGGIAISCFLTGLDLGFRFVNMVLGRPYFIDEMTGIGLILIWFFVITPLIIAATGALSMKLAGSRVSDIKSCLMTSFATGLIAIVIALAIYFFISAYFTGPQRFDETSITYETRYFIESLTGVFTNSRSIASMFLYALFSLIGGVLYYRLQIKKQAPSIGP